MEIQKDKDSQENPLLELKTLDLELEVEVSAEGQAGLKFLIVDVQGAVSGKRSHRIKLSFEPYVRQPEARTTYSPDGDSFTPSPKGKSKFVCDIPDIIAKMQAEKKGRIRVLPFADPIATVVLEKADEQAVDVVQVLKDLKSSTQHEWELMLAPKVKFMPGQGKNVGFLE